MELNTACNRFLETDCTLFRMGILDKTRGVVSAEYLELVGSSGSTNHEATRVKCRPTLC